MHKRAPEAVVVLAGLGNMGGGSHAQQCGGLVAPLIVLLLTALLCGCQDWSFVFFDSGRRVSECAGGL